MKLVNMHDGMVRLRVPSKGIAFELPPHTDADITLRQRMEIQHLLADLGLKVMSNEEYAIYRQSHPVPVASESEEAQEEAAVDPEGEEEGDIEVEEEDDSDVEDEPETEAEVLIPASPTEQVAGKYSYQDLIVKTKSQLWEISRGHGLSTDGSKDDLVNRILAFYGHAVVTPA